MKSRPKKVEALFDFLFENHQYNEAIQRDMLAMSLKAFDSNRPKALLLLHQAVNTQSKPRLEPIARFFQSTAKNPEAFDTFKAFSRFLVGESSECICIFDALKEKDGWGPKTAALFVRNLALIEESDELKRLFWADLEAIQSEAIYLPVDAVILSIFSKLDAADLEISKGPLRTFQGINGYLRDSLNFSNKQMLIWDDLWFWGFITQRSDTQTSRRMHAWNAAKYWSIVTAPKDDATVAKLEKLADDFLALTR